MKKLRQSLLILSVWLYVSAIPFMVIGEKENEDWALYLGIAFLCSATGFVLTYAVADLVDLED